jgi:hypothetical protein
MKDLQKNIFFALKKNLSEKQLSFYAETGITGTAMVLI